MQVIKKQVQRMQVALAMGVSVAVFAASGLNFDGEHLLLSVASGACGLLSGACWLLCG